MTAGVRDARRPRVVVLGGGMAALTAALELSEGQWHDRFTAITVYQRGWRLGGKGASSRGPHGRVEEHGLHLLLGYYDETFDTMRRCYEELDRARTDPASPIRTWDEAVFPVEHVGLTDRDGEGWLPWVASFSPTAGGPGRFRAQPRVPPLDFVVRSLRLLLDFHRSLTPVAPTGPGAGPGADRGSVYLSASPVPRGRRRSPSSAAVAVRGAALTGLALLGSLLRRLEALQPAALRPAELEAALGPLVGPLSVGVRQVLAAQPGGGHTYALIELVVASLVGITADRLLTRPEGFAAINHLDYREWLLSHGLDPAALQSSLLRGLSDLGFAYEQGDPARPRFSAGLGLDLTSRMFFSYSGSLFWKMRAGMGETVFAPLYQVLRERGVAFRFFHRVDALRLDGDGRSIEAIDVGIQAEPVGGPEAYAPLVSVKGLDCWPAGPIQDQLAHRAPEGVDLESFWSPRRDAGAVTLRRGRDFDLVVFGISLGMVPHVCADLVARNARWAAMVGHVGTVATQAMQLWLREDEAGLGWTGPPRPTMSGFAKPFDTWASMGHLLDLEDWPEEDRPKSIAYFCSTMAPPAAPGEPVDAAAADVALRARARGFLDAQVGGLWPQAVGAEGFRWELLCDGAGRLGPSGPEALSRQYCRANVDPSDLYVQSLPGTDRYRIPPGDTGFHNLVIAGDWTDCGLNAGCVEAATISGRLAGRAVLGRVDDGARGGPAS